MDDFQSEPGPTPAKNLQVLITGGGGLIGGALSKELKAAGHRVRHITRSPKSEEDIGWSPNEGVLDEAALEGSDVVVHLAGESVAQRWTDDAKERILNSRTKGTTLLASALGQLKRPPAVLLSASAVGYYGDGGTRALSEDSPKGGGFLSDVCERWEASAEPARRAGIRVAHPRFGIVLSSEGGALAKMLTPFRLGLGGRIGSGQQYMSWVHIDDVARALVFAIHADHEGALNIVAPVPVTNAVFTKSLGHAIRRPTVLPLPRFAAKLALGAEMADEMLLASQRVLPKALESHGFAFRYPEITSALESLVGGG